MSGVLDTLLEAFAATPPPAETPQQSAVRGAAQATAAQAQLRSGWNASKHPRAAGGRFGSTGGRKSATRSSTSSSRYLNSGAKGALVHSIQRQLHVAADGRYGPQTKAAVARYQRQHGLRVDGIVGAQTLAALRGHPSPSSVRPGPIASSTARVRTHPSQRVPRGQTRAAKIAKTPIPGPWTPVGGASVRMGGGVRV